MLWKRTFHHYRPPNTANRPSAPHHNVTRRMKATAAWRLNESEQLEHCAAWDLTRSLLRWKDGKRTLLTKKRWTNGSRIMLIARPLWQESVLKMRRQQLSWSNKRWEMLKRRYWQPQSPEHCLRRCWMPSEIAWAILHVLMMGEDGEDEDDDEEDPELG